MDTAAPRLLDVRTYRTDPGAPLKKRQNSAAGAAARAGGGALEELPEELVQVSCPGCFRPSRVPTAAAGSRSMVNKCFGARCCSTSCAFSTCQETWADPCTSAASGWQPAGTTRTGGCSAARPSRAVGENVAP